MGHPTLCSTRRFEKAFDHVDRNKALNAMKQHAVGKQHLAWISKLREQHILEMWLGHFTSRTFKTTTGAPKRSAREPNGVHSTGGHSACSSEKMVRKRDILQLQTGLVVLPKRGICRKSTHQNATGCSSKTVLMVEMGCTNYRIQKTQRRNIKQHGRTIQDAYKQHKTEKHGKITNNNSQRSCGSSMKQTKREDTSTAAANTGAHKERFQFAKELL